MLMLLPCHRVSITGVETSEAILAAIDKASLPGFLGGESTTAVPTWLSDAELEEEDGVGRGLSQQVGKQLLNCLRQVAIDLPTISHDKQS